MGKKVCVLGDGGWGTTLALLLHKNKHQVTLWSPFKDYAEELKSKRINRKFLPGIPIPAELNITSEIAEAVEPAEFIVFAVPTQFARKVLEQLKPFDLSNKVLVSVSKGIENETLMRMSEVIREVLGDIPRVILSGPTHAEEVAKGIPSSIVASSEQIAIAQSVQEIFMNDRFRVYTNADVVGVELGGSLKNVIAVAAGISDGLGFGDNTKAALITRGLAEMARLGKSMGAHGETFAGLSGMGDLITTCTSTHSRNRQLGLKLAEGIGLEKAVSSTEMVAEGAKTSLSAYQLAKRQNVEMPIVEGVYSVLYEGKDPSDVFKSLMKRQAKIENVEWN